MKQKLVGTGPQVSPRQQRLIAAAIVIGANFTDGFCLLILDAAQFDAQICCRLAAYRVEDMRRQPAITALFLTHLHSCRSSILLPSRLENLQAFDFRWFISARY